MDECMQSFPLASHMPYSLVLQAPRKGVGGGSCDHCMIHSKVHGLHCYIYFPTLIFLVD
jgi:hypothetical protein